MIEVGTSLVLEVFLVRCLFMHFTRFSIGLLISVSLYTREISHLSVIRVFYCFVLHISLLLSVVFRVLWHEKWTIHGQP